MRSMQWLGLFSREIKLDQLDLIKEPEVPLMHLIQALIDAEPREELSGAKLPLTDPELLKVIQKYSLNYETALSMLKVVFSHPYYAKYDG